MALVKRGTGASQSLPGAGRKTSATCRLSRWSSLKEFGADDLIARTAREAEHTAAETLSKPLGGLPLAHEQAAAYCERLGISLAEYRKRFEAAAVKFLDDKSLRQPNMILNFSLNIVIV